MMAEAALNSDDFVPDMQRRSIMNLVLLGGAAVPVGWMAGGFIYFFVPASGGGGGGALKALDANGDVVKAEAWATANPYPSTAEFALGGDARGAITSCATNRSRAFEISTVSVDTTQRSADFNWARASSTGVQSTPGGKAKQSFFNGGGVTITSPLSC